MSESRNLTGTTNIAVVLTDFDGTLTLISGGSLVFTPFYNKLMKKIGTQYPAELKDVPELVSLMQDEFGPAHSINCKHDARRLTQEAVNFLHAILKRNDIKIAVITRNLEKYIQAMLAYEGFTTEEINKIVIIAGKRKKEAADDYLSEIKFTNQEVNIVIATDDDLHDSVALETGAKKHCNNVQRYHHCPGKFDWQGYLSKINESLNNTLGCKVDERREHSPKHSNNMQTCLASSQQSIFQFHVTTRTSNQEVNATPRNNNGM